MMGYTLSTQYNNQLAYRSWNWASKILSKIEQFVLKHNDPLIYKGILDANGLRQQLGKAIPQGIDNLKDDMREAIFSEIASKLYEESKKYGGIGYYNCNPGEDLNVGTVYDSWMHFPESLFKNVEKLGEVISNCSLVIRDVLPKELKKLKPEIFHVDDIIDVIIDCLQNDEQKQASEESKDNNDEWELIDAKNLMPVKKKKQVQEINLDGPKEMKLVPSVVPSGLNAQPLLSLDNPGLILDPSSLTETKNTSNSLSSSTSSSGSSQSSSSFSSTASSSTTAVTQSNNNNTSYMREKRLARFGSGSPLSNGSSSSQSSSSSSVSKVDTALSFKL